MLQNSLEVIQRLTGTYIDDTDTLTKDYPIKPLKPKDPTYWVTQALANNITILLAKVDLESTQQDTKIASSNLRPSVKLQASHARKNHSVNGTHTNNKIALVLSMPLFNGGSLNSKVRQSMTAQDISKSQQQGNERAVIQQIRSVIRDIHTNVLSISARQQSIVSSKAALEAISEGFNVGTRNIVDLLDAEQAVFSAHNQYDNARLNHIKLLFNLEFQLGSIAEHNINKLAQWMTTAIKSSGFF